MTAIRQDLGVCPQFDILWPEITVKEHMMLYAAIKGFTRQQQLDEATTAAHDVGESSSCCCDSFMTRQQQLDEATTAAHDVGELPLCCCDSDVTLIHVCHSAAANG